MFDIAQARTRERNLAFVASFLIQCLLVLALAERAPMFVRPSAIAWGQHGTSSELVYVPRHIERPQLKKQSIHLTKRKPVQLPAPTPAEMARAGTPLGSLASGPGSGVEAIPAIPLIFPDPAIYPWQLKGVRGDVIVEVTIDDHGNVTATKILQSLQQDIDDKVVATLKGWRFRPASMDGMAISSRQDVHFHYPS